MTKAKGLEVEALAVLVSRRVRLRRFGNRWTGLCPFHDERRPSFAVYAGKKGEGRYHCHGCHADGDAVDWLRKIEGRTYREAGGMKADPVLTDLRKRERQRETRLQAFRDRHPDTPLPDWAIA